MTHLVVIPTFNSGARLLDTVLAARAAWDPVWVVVDGSNDGSDAALVESSGLRMIRRARNGGKGAAVLDALRLAASAGFTHALVMDGDGQHPAAQIPIFMAASQARPEAMVLGVPQFGPDAPALRVGGRRISNWCVQLETGWAGIGDSLFGFRVYPIGKLLPIMQRSSWMRRFDFDPEAAVRLSWAGVPAVNLPAPVRYWPPEDGGVSHFRYGRDNLLLTAMHARLLAGGAAPPVRFGVARSRNALARPALAHTRTRNRDMTEKTKTEHADRTVGGPGSSHQNADKPETHHHRERERDQQKGSNDAGDHQGPSDGGIRPSGRHGPEAPRHPKD